MACSREDMRKADRPGRICSVALACIALVAALVWPASASAQVSAMDLTQQPLSVEQVSARALGMEERGEVEDGSVRLSVARLCPMQLSASCSPASIQAGVSCGMDWMCGLYPCLCGSSDAWGGCSCNGLETATPELSFTSTDESVVRVVQFAGRTWLVPVGAGTATVSCDASLRYHEDAEVAVQVSVGGLTAADGRLIALCAGALAIVIAVVAGIWALIRRKERTTRS